MFKKLFLFVGLTILALSCGKKETIKVAAAGYPMEEIVKIAAEDLKKEGYDTKITLLTDYVTANVGLANKDFDANFHQHVPFMEIFNKKNNAHLVKVAAIYDVYVGFYSKKYKSKNEKHYSGYMVIKSYYPKHIPLEKAMDDFMYGISDIYLYNPLESTHSNAELMEDVRKTCWSIMFDTPNNDVYNAVIEDEKKYPIIY